MDWLITSRARLYSIVALTLFLFLGSACPAQNPAAQISGEIERLQKSLQEKALASPDFPEIDKRIGETLRESQAALDAGLEFTALEKLGQAEDLLQGARSAVDQADAIKNNLSAFETQWGKVELQLASAKKDAAKHNWERSPAALRAIAETAQTKSVPLLEGGRGFAVATKPADGLFYMGQAQGEIAFASFVASINQPTKKAPPALRSLLPELQRLQEKTNGAFQPPKSIDLHPRFIALNSTLKLAGELDASKLYAGALYQYLEAVRHFGMLNAAVPDAAGQQRLKQTIALRLKEVRSSQRDDSIAQVLLERAQAYISHPDGSKTTEDEWKAAQVIVEQVMPAYAAALKPAAPLQARSGRHVTITLVRWPYT